jgi:fibronectin-binding autotransporter adhesin
MTRVVAVRAGLGNSTAGTATTLSVGAGGALISGGLGLSMQYAGVISDLSSFNTAAIGNLTVTGNSFLLLSNANTFTGTTSIVGANSLLQLGNSLALQDSTLSTSGGGGVSFGTLTAATLGGLTGSQNLTLTNTALGGVALTIGNNGGTFSGDLSGNGSLVMHGTGTEVLNDATYTGATTLYQGNLTIGGSSDIVGAGNIDLVGAFGTNSGYGNTLTVTGNAIINTTGTIFLASNDGQNGANSPGLGVLLVTGTSSVTAGNLDLGNGSRTPAGTSVTISQSGTLDILGTISLEHTIGSTVGPNSVNLNSGTLAVGNFIFGVGNGTTQYANINFNGGTLEALANDPTGSYFLVEPTNSTRK